MTIFNIFLGLKTSNKLGIEGIYPNIIKDLYDKPTANILLNGKQLKVISLRSGTRQEWQHSPIQHSTDSPRQNNWQGKKKKEVIQIRKEEVKMPLFADDQIFDIGNSRYSQKT